MTQPDASPRSHAPLSPERWAHVRALVDAALALASEKRPEFLAASCHDDDALRISVERLVEGCERSEGRWGILSQSAAELAAPLLLADSALVGDQDERTHEPPPALRAALADRYAVGDVLGRGGMATVYVADDLRHHRRVALKVLDPRLGAILGVDRFVSEIRVTAGLQHPNILPLFDSGEAGGLLYYVTPLIAGDTLRARLTREKQLPLDEAIRIVSTIAGALSHAHRQGVVHRDLKPENILMLDAQPLVADFGIALAVTKAGDSRLTGSGMSLGTPQYMSPEQANVDPAIDGRSDIYSLACMLYEMLAGDPPFTGSTVSAVIAKVRGDPPSSVRTVRPSVPVHVDAALARALAKLPADRYATVREFADALALAPVGPSAGARTTGTRWRRSTRLLLGVATILGVASAAWMMTRKPVAPSWFVDANLIDPTHRSSVAITPDGGATVYTGPAESGRPIMLRPVGQITSRVIDGTLGGWRPFVSPDGQRIVFMSSSGNLTLATLDGVARSNTKNAWRFGNGAWVDDSTVVSSFAAAGLTKGVPGTALTQFTRPDSVGSKHDAPLSIPGTRLVVFTARRGGGPGLVVGQLAIASLDEGRTSIAPHVPLGIAARRAIAFVDGWLLYISENGKAIMAARLDLAGRRIVGSPIPVLNDAAGNLEGGSLADNGTLLYVRRPRGNSVMLVDAKGAVRPIVASSDESFMHPRISPDGKRFVMQIMSGPRSDVWLYDIATGTPTQLTTTGDAFHPVWTPDGRRIVFMAGGVLVAQLVDGGTAERIPGTERPFGPSVTTDGRSVVFQRRSDREWGIWSASLTGGAARKVMDDPFATYMPAVSPDRQRIAYVSKATGYEEVYARPYPGPGPAVQISERGGIEPAWSPDGRQIYYHIRSVLMAVTVTPALAITSRTTLFKGAFDEHLMPHRNYDVAPDGSGFLMVSPPKNPETVMVLDWLPELRARLARAR